MPNHCYNHLSITAPNIGEIITLLRNDEGDPLSFDRVVPMPEPFRSGAPGWYEWSVENWGTKWDAYNFDSPDEPTIEGDTATWTFDTAWSPPQPFVRALAARFPSARIVHFFIEEGNCFAGKVTYAGGAEESRYEPEWDSDEGIRFRSEWGWEPGSDEDGETL
jgi:hypothetical protein